MSLPTHMTTVTPLSSALALFLFALLPLAAFFLGSYISPYNHSAVLEKNEISQTNKTYTAFLEQKVLEQEREIASLEKACIQEKDLLPKE